MTNRTRCAIYTRKSTDDGLEQEFNSLDAQREACEAYITSQRSMGWVALSTVYNDGGLSGGTMERPALHRLLGDIKKRKIDTVVVYKVDRLTRSLADFAKIVEIFDGHGISFVSVTQQFNTTTSMGRLTLNMLLSFAQFEREVTGERIRDKIAASKKKGMWMGGLPPLGYDVADKKLVVNADEAETIRTLFRLYLELNTVKKLVEETDRLGLVTKRRMRSGGRETGGQLFTRGHLYQLLANPIYVGDIAHKGVAYRGQHQGIIKRRTFDAVRRQLDGNAANRGSTTNTGVPSLLSGLVYDETGDRLIPSHANKKGRRYRYYISKRLMRQTASPGDGWRLPAKELDGAVLLAVAGFLKDELRLIDTLQLNELAPNRLRKILLRATEFADELIGDQSEQRHPLLRRFLYRATLSSTAISIELLKRDLLKLVLEQPNDSSDETDSLIHIEVPTTFKRRGVEAKLTILSSDHCAPDAKLIALIARSYEWVEQLSTGAVSSVREIARQDNLHEGDVSRFLPLAYLAPDIAEAVVLGRQPTELTCHALRRACPIPYSWDAQRELLGIPG